MSRQYNNAFAFSSMGYRPDERINTIGPPVFTIHGKIYHRMYDLNHGNDCPKYAQIYFTDFDDADDEELSRANGKRDMKPAAMDKISKFLKLFNPYARTLKNAMERV